VDEKEAEMNIDQSRVSATVRSLALSASIEMTPASQAYAGKLARLLGGGTAVYVPYLPRAQFGDTISVCRHLIGEGLSPVPHLAARAIPSRRQLDNWLSELAAAGVDSLFLIAGDAARPCGPFFDTLRILETGLLQRHGFNRLGIGGFPEGHPHIDTAACRRALAFKTAYARETGTEMWLVTQFVFEAEPFFIWLRALRDDGFAFPVRIGIPGPAQLRTLLAFALRCGIGASAKALAQRPAMVQKLASRWSPDPLLASLARGCLADPLAPILGIHVFPFGGIRQSAEWLITLREPASSLTGTDDTVSKQEVMAS
jgi:methylenetetrahydrofolate reductase (NADH)